MKNIKTIIGVAALSLVLLSGCSAYSLCEAYSYNEVTPNEKNVFQNLDELIIDENIELLNQSIDS